MVSRWSSFLPIPNVNNRGLATKVAKKNPWKKTLLGWWSTVQAALSSIDVDSMAKWRTLPSGTSKNNPETQR